MIVNYNDNKLYLNTNRWSLLPYGQVSPILPAKSQRILSHPRHKNPFRLTINP